jgi:sugar phosphate isomerase/epimerase
MALSTGSFHPHLSTLEGCQAAAQAGFSRVEIVLQGREEHNLSFAHQVARVCINLKVKPVALHPRAEFFQTSDYQKDADCLLFRQMLDFADLIESPLIVFHGPERRPDIEGNCEVINGLLQMAKAARRKGIRFTLENSPSGFCQSPKEFKEIITWDKDFDL